MVGSIIFLEDKMQYQLKLQQLVTYSRCRIYRKFIHTLAEDTNIRLNGDSYLFYFMLLCSLANFRTSCISMDGISYTIAPGEWMLTVKELMKLFRKKSIKDTVALLDYLSERKFISYIITDHGHSVKYTIHNWAKFNTVVEANAPCTKDDGFFFFPYRLVSEFIGSGKCSEMDIILDLWLNTIYNDTCIPGSDVGPVVYIRNGSRSPLIGYEELGKRWGISKSTAGRIMRKLEETGYIKMVAFQGKYGTAIYLCNYLSTMFQISDIKIDKEEVAMALNIRVNIPEEEEIMEENEIMDTEKAIALACQNSENEVSEAQISVSKNLRCVPKSHLVKMIQKAAKALYLQGIACCTCAHARYLLSPLSQDCKSKTVNAELLIHCPESEIYYRFALTIEPVDDGMESEVI